MSLESTFYMPSAADDGQYHPCPGPKQGPHNSSALLSVRARNLSARFRGRVTILSVFLFLCLFPDVCRAQSRDVTCSQGTGDFETEFSTGVQVHVGAARNGGLATRACEGTLSWGRLNLVIATGAELLDVDTVGVDLGVGALVATFQVQKSNTECCRSYQIYSLQEPPRLLRIITGGSSFSAADTDLDGRVEIWTDDAASVDGIENLPLSELDFAPPIILRFEHSKLLDVSSEFQSYFDEKISAERAEIGVQDIRDFKSSDGRLASDAPYSPQRLYQLRTVKMKVLEIVWAYLYSSREQEAWSALADMWPAADSDRIREVLLIARARGIRSQIDGVSTQGPIGRKKHARIFDARTGWAMREGETNTQLSVIPPKPILIERLPPLGISEQSLPESETGLDLVIDSAGKVRSANPSGNVQWVDASLMNSTAKWKFIPAFSSGRPVASRINFAVSLRR
jgi:hypothetical protein